MGDKSRPRVILIRTSNDSAYQFLTFSMEGAALNPCGSDSNSFMRCARRTGSSSSENNQVRLLKYLALLTEEKLPSKVPMSHEL
jgi:hypothetical protein